MKYLMLLLFATTLLVFSSSCTKQESGFTSTACKGGCVTKTGVISRQGPTTYQYGTHILTTNSGEEYILVSTIVDLDKRVEQKCIVLMEDLHYSAEGGPALYNVTVIRPSL
ncbi:MAG: hypothetical protein KDC07_01030 [Chitinophagaceae bacterium]|nr:hypothetical protein [Chitinophagaceae bacterium]MCB9046965.1 hypothetical protein [Chitinophagales bacterium]